MTSALLTRPEDARKVALVQGLLSFEVRVISGDKDQIFGLVISTCKEKEFPYEASKSAVKIAKTASSNSLGEIQRILKNNQIVIDGNQY